MTEHNKVEPLWNKKALSIGDSLLVADLHVGYERELEEKGVNLPSQTDNMSKEITNMLEDGDFNRLIINGDLKHNIPSSSWQEYKEIPKLLDIWLGLVERIHLLPGNHDGGIQKYLPSDVELEDSTGYVIGDVGILHGHSNPSEEVLTSETIVIAHSHPTVSLIDSLGQRDKLQCWIKLKFEFKGYDGDIIVMPHFNNLMGGNSINENGYIGPLLKNSEIYDEKIHLLDGTYLGTMDKIRSLQKDIEFS